MCRKYGAHAEEAESISFGFETGRMGKGVIEGLDLTDEQQADEDFMREFDAKHDIVYD